METSRIGRNDYPDAQMGNLIMCGKVKHKTFKLVSHCAIWTYFAPEFSYVYDQFFKFMTKRLEAGSGP